MTSYEVVTLVIAVVGLALSLASLTWQAATFLLSGSRVKVELRHGAIGPAAIMTDKVGSEIMKYAERQGFTEEVLAVKVRNVGRLAVSVTDYAARLDNGTSVHPFGEAIGPPLPYRLDAHSEATWYVRMEHVRRVAAAAQLHGQRVRMVVELGTGKRVRTKDAILV